MTVNVLELEYILNKEFDVFSTLEKHMIDKKTYLIKNDVDGLKKVDIDIESLSVIIADLEAKKVEIIQKSAKKQNISGVLEEISDENKVKELSLLKDKVKNKILKVQRQNKINEQLVSHALNLVENTIKIFTNALTPNNSAYNNMGKANKNKEQIGMSSIIQEA